MRQEWAREIEGRGKGEKRWRERRQGRKTGNSSYMYMCVNTYIVFYSKHSYIYM